MKCQQFSGMDHTVFSSMLAIVRNHLTHVERDDNIAKFWLDPVRLQRSGGFRRPDLRKIEQMIREARTELLEGWNEYFSG
jgi:hypothetical protein